MMILKGMLRSWVFSNFLLSLLCASLFFVMVNFKLYYLVWVCLVPAIAIFQRGERCGGKSWLNVLFAVLIAFLIATGSFYWLGRYSSWFFVFVVFVITFFGFLIGIIHVLFNRNVKNVYLRILFFPFIWFILLIGFSFFEYGNMWMMFAYFQPMMFPLGYVLGPIGLTVFIILFNSLLANYFVDMKRGVLIVIAILFLLVVSSTIYSSFAEVQGREVNVALVQGMVGHEWTWRLTIPDLILDKYENLTLQLRGQNIDIIVWPEYAITADFSVNKTLRDRVSNLAVEMDSYIVLGTFSYIDKNNIGFFDDKTDRILIFSPNGSLTNYYDSSRVISSVGDIVSVEESTEAIELDDFSFNLGLCFEEYMDKGSLRGDDGDFIVIATNNNHFDGTVGLDLIAQFSRLKALEKHKYVLRSTNSGITQIVNPYGKVVSKMGSSRSGVLVGKIYI